ncbi:two-component system, unclassified family, sensor histidine kinase and response regulator [Fodinibius roseus]|uniref:histidine kinase n=1 Tax=Fodinibius roseus TaxID=1194090 RepID=A0A1M5ENR6_9BACT|nr:hybrid sensor histidine kinase/response regulator [Fodinibius roseus]SHF80855.1 two-component system, unclassified family, sensor histidine kinase and response regulator [Fodinibius roseus]
MQDDMQEQDFVILIVDDIAKNIQLLGKILDNRGYEVVAATKGNQVLKAARNHDPDLILLDIMMPEKSGFEVCEELKADEDLAEIPVIFLTARSDEEDIIKGLNLGGADYVTKPFNSGELLARIDTHLSLKNARDRIIRQREKLQQLSKTREKLYSIIAHDLKGALFGISGLAEVVDHKLRDQPVDEETKDNIKRVSHSLTVANSILENLLAWARLQTDKLKMNPETFSLSEEIDKNVQLLQTLARQKQVEIQLELDNENITVEADKQMLSTIIRNLLANAIKFSSAGDKVILEVTSTDSRIRLSVQDEGVGMPAEVQEHIFNPDDRPKRPGTDKESGTGLGLLLCKEFIEAHNGEIRVESEVGQGTDFQFVIPQ